MMSEEHERFSRLDIEFGIEPDIRLVEATRQSLGERGLGLREEDLPHLTVAMALKSPDNSLVSDAFTDALSKYKSMVGEASESESPMSEENGSQSYKLKKSDSEETGEKPVPVELASPVEVVVEQQEDDHLSLSYEVNERVLQQFVDSSIQKAGTDIQAMMSKHYEELEKNLSEARSLVSRSQRALTNTQLLLIVVVVFQIFNFCALYFGWHL